MGGLSAAIALAAAGQRVTVIEQLERPGGRVGEHVQQGFRWDTGPSVITMRDVYDRLFALAGRRLDEFVDLIALEPITRYFWRDGLTLDATRDRAAMQRQIAEFSPVDVDAYGRFLDNAAAVFERVKAPFLYRGAPGLRDLFSLPLADVFKIDALRTMHQATRAAFRDPHLAQLFDRFATYNGSSPYRAPATLNTIAHVEMTLGAWYPRGGVVALARAYETLARALGVTLRYATPVRGITIEGGRVREVRLDEGMLAADAVVCNADHAHAARTLLPGVGDGARLEPSSSGLVLLLGVRGAHPQLAHHNVFFCADYAREFDDLFARGVPPDDPTLYACITSKTDAGHAPPGCENWFVLVNAPALSPTFDWDRQGPAYMQRVKALLAERAGLDPGAIVCEQVITPAQMQAQYGGNRGAIYGYSSNTRSAAFMRPANRDPQVRGLYYAGGSAHPGGGVPLVTLSGMAAARCVLEDIG